MKVTTINITHKLNGGSFSASKYTDFSVFLRKSHSIYGEKSKNTEGKSAEEGAASIATNGKVRVKPRKIRGKFPLDTDDVGGYVVLLR